MGCGGGAGGWGGSGVARRRLLSAVRLVVRGVWLVSRGSCAVARPLVLGPERVAGLSRAGARGCAVFGSAGREAASVTARFEHVRCRDLCERAVVAVDTRLYRLVRWLSPRGLARCVGVTGVWEGGVGWARLARYAAGASEGGVRRLGGDARSLRGGAEHFAGELLASSRRGRARGARLTCGGAGGVDVTRRLGRLSPAGSSGARCRGARGDAELRHAVALAGRCRRRGGGRRADARAAAPGRRCASPRCCARVEAELPPRVRAPGWVPARRRAGADRPRGAHLLPASRRRHVGGASWRGGERAPRAARPRARPPARARSPRAVRRGGAAARARPRVSARRAAGRCFGGARVGHAAWPQGPGATRSRFATALTMNAA